MRRLSGCFVSALRAVGLLLTAPRVLNVGLCGSTQDSQSKQGGYSMHQLQGNKEFGCEKKGYLLKKSDG